jgi:hypothetical protein
MRLSIVSTFAAAVLFVSFASANAQQAGIQVGVLDCHGGPSNSYVVGSNATLGCVLSSAQRPAEPYVAQITRLGVDLGSTQATRLTWTVYSTTTRIGRGDLSGVYNGVGGNASVGVGGGGNALVGGSANSFALQPVSLQGQTGLNVSGGIVSLQLSPGGLVHRRHHRHH